ncbi:MAG: DNA-3-methyladenine glycosylase [Acidimicrobiia bacterium]
MRAGPRPGSKACGSLRLPLAASAYGIEYGTVTDSTFLDRTADLAAPRLLGWHLVSHIDGVRTEVVLTEVEAYRQDDPASHSYGGPRGRNVVMFDRPGLLYVYRSYGVHWCANVVCGEVGVGSAILLRAGRPISGQAAMARRRGRNTNLTSGPGNLCQALGITGLENGLDLFNADSPVRLTEGEPPANIAVTPRIGISKAIEVPWRFLTSQRG